MSAQKNEANRTDVGRRSLEQRQYRRAEAYLFTTYAWAELSPVFGTGSEGLLNFVRGFRAGFPDLHFAIEDVVTNDDKVVWRCIGTGTHRGEFMGMPATGKSFQGSGHHISRFENVVA